MKQTGAATLSPADGAEQQHAHKHNSMTEQSSCTWVDSTVLCVCLYQQPLAASSLPGHDDFVSNNLLTAALFTTATPPANAMLL
jgi:hypothetical protein